MLPYVNLESTPYSKYIIEYYVCTMVLLFLPLSFLKISYLVLSNRLIYQFLLVIEKYIYSSSDGNFFAPVFMLHTSKIYDIALEFNQ